MTELHRVQIATVLTADAELDAQAGRAGPLRRQFHELADTDGVERGNEVFLKVWASV